MLNLYVCLDYPKILWRADPLNMGPPVHRSEELRNQLQGFKQHVAEPIRG